MLDEANLPPLPFHDETHTHPSVAIFPLLICWWWKLPYLLPSPTFTCYVTKSDCGVWSHPHARSFCATT